MAFCNACGWAGDAGDCRQVEAVDPGLCPDCLSTDVVAEAGDGVADDVQGDDGG